MLHDCAGLERDPNLVSQTPCTDEVKALQSTIDRITHATAGDGDPVNLSSVNDLEYILRIAKGGSDIPDRVHSLAISGHQLADFAADDVGAQGGGGLGDPIDQPWQIPVKIADPIFLGIGELFTVFPWSREDVQQPMWTR